jgi:endonuclease/exonuclease/phosphatase family metal-dependent hydrolase
VAEAQRLRVATFNIRHAAPKDSYRGLPDKLAQSCAELDADILALQEVDVGVPRSQRANLAEVAAQACGMAYYFAKARKHAYRGQYGNALLARGSISEVEVVELGGDHRHTLKLGSSVLKPFREPRNAIIATVTVRGHAISVGTGHFAADPSARKSQLTRVAEGLIRRPEPHLLVGDFNIPWQRAAAWLQPYGLQLAEALLEPSNPALQTGIDHVAVRGLVVDRVESRWLPISDHAAKIVDVTIPPG